MKNDIVVKKFGKFVTKHVLYTHAICQFLADEETSGASVRAYTVCEVATYSVSSANPPSPSLYKVTRS